VEVSDADRSGLLVGDALERRERDRDVLAVRTFLSPDQKEVRFDSLRVTTIRSSKTSR
jgi:hypothetical protein